MYDFKDMMASLCEANGDMAAGKALAADIMIQVDQLKDAADFSKAGKLTQAINRIAVVMKVLEGIKGQLRNNA